MKTIYKLFFIFALFIVCASFGGRAEAYTFAYAGLYNKVPMISEGNESELIGYIDGGTEEFIVELADSRKGIDVIDNTPDVTMQRYNEIRLQLEMCEIPLELQDVDTDYIIYGCITSLGKGNSRQGLLFVNGVSDTVRLDLSVRIIERKTGKIVFTATSKAEGQAKGIGFFKAGKTSFSKEALYQAATKAMIQAADKIKNAI